MDLVTGGSGFLGAALVRELLAAGRSVRVLDDHSRGRASRLVDLAGPVEVVTGDVRDAATTREATEGCDIVWHLAAVNGTRHFYESPDRVLDVGIGGTLAALTASVTAGARRFVFVSSSEVYASPEEVPTPETTRLVVPDVCNPRFSYGGAKIAGELLTLHMGARQGLEVVVVRPHNIYGPDMGEDHVIPELVRKIADQMRRGRPAPLPLPIQGDGAQTRAFCHIRDGARGLFIAGIHAESGAVLHLGTDRETTIAELAERIAARLGTTVELRPGPLPTGGTLRRCPDITALRGLGYRPEVSLEQGLVDTVAWYARSARAGDTA